MANIIPFRRKRRHRLPPIWTPYLRHRGWSAAQLRLTAWTGMLLGLLAFQAMRLVPPPEQLVETTPTVESLDPFEEARRSRAILEGQEGAPERAILDAPGEMPAHTTPSGGVETRAISEPARVIDGDTFDYQSMRVRIADIDAPEVHGRCAYETELAARATQRMRALLAAGPFELHPLSDRDEDRYGRKLRIVTRGGRSLGDLLVAEGLARTWSGRREPWCV
jgi:micrococcal nuclease